MNWDVIHSYSRAEALADGVLVDVSKTAGEAGIKHPTALTAAVWAEFVAVPEGLEGQDEAGRLWDVLWMFAVAARRSGGGDTLYFPVLVQNDSRGPREVRLKAVVGPGDDPAPVVTIMLPDED